MHIVQKVRNVLRGLIQRYGTENIKRYIWDNEYSRGRWNGLDMMADDCVYPHVEKQAKKGSILDLGCGPGSTGNELNAAAYRSYTGVDISDVAINKARARTETNGRTNKNDYFQSDIFSYLPKQQYDVILFGDSVYYVPRSRIAEMLVRYSKYLKQGGVFIVRIYDVSGKYRAIIEAIESNFDVVEKHVYHQSQVSVITFRPPASGYASRLANTDEPCPLA